MISDYAFRKAEYEYFQGFDEDIEYQRLKRIEAEENWANTQYDSEREGRE